MASALTRIVKVNERVGNMGDHLTKYELNSTHEIIFDNTFKYKQKVPSWCKVPTNYFFWTSQGLVKTNEHKFFAKKNSLFFFFHCWSVLQWDFRGIYEMHYIDPRINQDHGIKKVIFVVCLIPLKYAHICPWGLLSSIL